VSSLDREREGGRRGEGEGCRLAMGRRKGRHGEWLHGRGLVHVFVSVFS
jgi:hypothetical protein